MKTVLISGGSKGLGLSLAHHLSVKDYQITTFARGDAPRCQGITHLPGIDAASEAQLEGLRPHLGQTDCLVNNVGVAYDGLLATQGPESIKMMLEVNLFSVLYLTKLYVRERMTMKKPGVVVTISSIISERGFAGLSTYAATKGALNSMTRALAREMGPKGFRFNAVLPGYFESDLSKSLSSDKKQQIIRRTPLGRLAETSDINPLIEFLLSDDSKFITGQCMVVDGGLTI